MLMLWLAFELVVVLELGVALMPFVLEVPVVVSLLLSSPMDRNDSAKLGSLHSASKVNDEMSKSW